MRLALLIFSILFFQYNSISQPKFNLIGTIDSIKTGEIWLTRFYPDSTAFDTSQIIDGKFIFKLNGEQPVKARLDIKDGKRDYFEFIQEPISQYIHGLGYPLANWSINGGGLNEAHKKYTKYLAFNTLQLKAINFLLMNTNDSNKIKIDSLNKRESNILKERKYLEEKFILENKSIHFSAFLIEDMYRKYNNAEELISVFHKLDYAVKQSKLGRSVKKALYEFIEPKFFKNAPEIVQKDTAGKLIKLSSLRGKYVLVDFWASWCNPCRAENPNLVAMYKKYKNSKFEILSISYDSKLENWKEAIIADSLNWLHVSELNEWQNSTSKTYKISAIPQNVLVSPQGKIIAKNLEGEALDKKLKSIFKY